MDFSMKCVKSRTENPALTRCSIGGSESDTEKHYICDPIVSLPDSDVSQYVEIIKMPPGVVACLVDIPKGVKTCTRFESANSPLEFTFCLEGYLESKFDDPGRFENMMIIEGNSCIISRATGASGVSVNDSSVPLKMVSICFDPHIMELYLKDSMASLRDEYKSFAGRNNTGYFIKSLPITPMMQAAANRILLCKYKDPVRNIFISGKVSELMSLVVMDIMLNKPDSQNGSLHPADMERIMKAKDILIESIENPPTLTELARKVCLNDFKLKSGFKEVFGTTVYGYLQQQRMEKAKSLLESGYCNVSEAAWNLGYSNVSHFITAFRKQYGINPGQFMHSAR